VLFALSGGGVQFNAPRLVDDSLKDAPDDLWIESCGRALHQPLDHRTFAFRVIDREPAQAFVLADPQYEQNAPSHERKDTIIDVVNFVTQLV
jgi:hypothetical protein